MTPRRMTAAEQLTALQHVAELVGIMLLEIPPAKFSEQPTAFVGRERLAKIEAAMVVAGYDMPAVRAQYKRMTAHGDVDSAR